MDVKLCVVFSVLLLAGCVTTTKKTDPNNFSHISEGIKERTDYALKEPSQPVQFEIPQSVTLDNGLSQDEAIALALWNNAQFQSDLAALGFARADLLEADMISNPVFSILFPVGPKLLETALNVPIDILWQRPRRMAVAQLESQKVAENLITNGLGLIKNVQIEYAILSSIQEKKNLAQEQVQLKKQMVKLEQSRLKTGEISELNAEASYVDLLQAENTLRNIIKEYEISKQKLRSLLGITSDDLEFEIVQSNVSTKSSESLDDMLEAALLCRPDLRAAELAIESAGEKIGWEKSKIYNFIAVLDGDDTENDSFTIRPGFSVEIPIFNQNDAKIARAKAELEQAAKKYEAIRQNIILDVKMNYTQYLTTYEELDTWNNNLIPSLESVFEQTQKSYQAGDVSLIPILNANSNLIEARMSLIELNARLNTCIAELNYSIGKKMI